MSGQLAINAPHLDGTEPVGVWFDAAWTTYLDVLLKIAQLGEGGQEKIDDLYDELTGVDEPGQPTMETWGSSERAQRGQAAMFAMLGGMPGGMGSDSDAGAAESVGSP